MALCVLREERGVALISQLAGMVVAIAILGAVTTVFDASMGVFRKSEAATTTVQKAQSGIDLMVNTITDAVKGGSPAIQGTDKIVVVQIPLTGGGLKVVRFCLQTGGSTGGVLYQQMVYEASIDSSFFISRALTAPCPDWLWTYNGSPSAIVLADRITNYQESPTYPLFTYSAAPTDGRQSLAIDLWVTPQNAIRATELTGSVTPRLQIGPG